MLSLAAVGAIARDLARIDRAADVLRLLGRLEFVPSRWVRDLIFPDYTHRMAAWRTLDRLHTHKLIWRAPVHPSKLPGAMRWRNGKALDMTHYVYGLTEQGRGWLVDQGVEPLPEILDTFVVRDHKQPEVKPAQLAHDLLVVDWCVSVIDHARRCPLVTGIRCQLEYVSCADERGQAYQRFDALLMLTIDAALPERQIRPGWQIPWDDRTVPDAGTIRVLRMACELDRGTEKLATLMAKAATYAQLSQLDHYTLTLGGPVLPVVIAPTPRRSVQIAREWTDGWPRGAGVISSFTRAKDPRLGALFGTYYTMTDVPAQRVALLDTVGLPQDMWAELTALWQPGTMAIPHTRGGAN